MSHLLIKKTFRYPVQEQKKELFDNYFYNEDKGYWINKKNNQPLKVVEALLMECLKCCQEQGIKFIGEWNITFFEAILDSITSFISDIEQIVAE